MLDHSQLHGTEQGGSAPVGLRFSGRKKRLLALALAQGLLSLLTLGLYRFWGKTKIRQYFWAETQLQGDRFEYRGTGLEKFLGFLEAVVILAIWLGGAQLWLTYYSFSLLADHGTGEGFNELLLAGLAWLLTMMPPVFFALYRAQRYRMARTLFRGIRFGMVPGAWGYMGRALWHYGLALVTLGFLWPRASFYLRRYMTERSFYGTAAFVLKGRWWGLCRATAQIWVALVWMFVGLVFFGTDGEEALGMTLLGVSLLWMAFGVMSYQVRSFAWLMDHTELHVPHRSGMTSQGGAVSIVRFRARPRRGRVLRCLIFGWLLAALATGGMLLGLTVVGLPLFEVFAALSDWVEIAVVYFLVFALFKAFSLLFVTRPLMAHYLETMQVDGAEALWQVRQRSYDEGADAGGFAAALDVGGVL